MPECVLIQPDAPFGGLRRAFSLQARAALPRRHWFIISPAQTNGRAVSLRFQEDFSNQRKMSFPHTRLVMQYRKGTCFFTVRRKFSIFTVFFNCTMTKDQEVMLQRIDNECHETINRLLQFDIFVYFLFSLPFI